MDKELTQVRDDSLSLRQIIEAHPDWLDFKVVVYRPDGVYDYVGAAGSVYLADEVEDINGSACRTGNKLVVFAAN